MDDCIFCKIVTGEVDSVKIWEDENYLAILDGNPNTKGMTLVMPKAHYVSYVFDIPESIYFGLMEATRKVAKILEKGLDVKRVAQVMEGMGVNHSHIKLYPLYGLEEKFKETWAKDKVSFDNYQGYISTQLGPKADINDLKKVAEEIKSRN